VLSLSIRWRLAGWIVLAFILALIVIFVTLHFSLQRILADDLDSGLSRDAERVLAQIILLGSLEDEEQLQEIVQQNSGAGIGDTPFITVVRDIQGNVLASTPGLAVEDLGLSPADLERIQSGESIDRTISLPGPQDIRVRATSVSVAGTVLGVVQVGEGTEAANHSLDRLQLILLAEGIGGSIVALAIAYWLSRGALKPLAEVVRVAAEIEASDLSRRIRAGGQPSEVQQLADTFDAMLGRLERAFQEQRNFVLDVSHDLRTPLAALRGNIDVLLMSNALDPEVKSQLERMSAETGRLIRLTTNLLYLASADAGREPERRTVELDVLCLEVYRQMKDLRSDVILRLGNEDQVTVVGDRDLLKQMVVNLAENAMKYSAPGGVVTLSLVKSHGQARILVEDTGPGIPPEHLPHIFERFYRGDDRGKTGGSGVGLAIARWVASVHGGDVTVESVIGQGSTFRVALPLDGGAPIEAPGV
jgi:signal transduction histidine kinase